MNPLQQQINQLMRQVQELMDWKAQKEAQQITMPLDQSSKEILNVDAITFIQSNPGGSPVAGGTITVEINGIQTNLLTT